MGVYSTNTLNHCMKDHLADNIIELALQCIRDLSVAVDLRWILLYGDKTGMSDCYTKKSMSRF